MKCEKDMAEIIHAYQDGFQNFPLEMKFKKEICYGRRFVNVKGEEVILGISKKAQDVLGLPFKHFESMQNQISELQEQHFNDSVFIKNIMMLNFWGRLKFAFTKIIRDEKIYKWG